MTTLIHLSDLHFGRDQPDLLPVLAAAVNDLRPDLVALSGDLTQRAWPDQFRKARALIDSLAAPVLCVPGNHDIPLYNLAERLVTPFRRWQRWIAADLAPVRQVPGMTVVGVNSVDPWRHQRGRIAGRALTLACRALSTAPSGDLRVVVMHHPLEQTATDGKDPMHAAAASLEALTRAGADLILCGHLHTWRVAPFAVLQGRRAAIQVQAGTVLSTRLRGEPNDFNVIRLRPDGSLTVDRHAAADASGFRPVDHLHFARGADGWASPSAPPPLTVAAKAGAVGAAAE